MKKILIIGATSGIGREAALIFAQRGWVVGAAGRRQDLLDSLRQKMPKSIFVKPIDVTSDDAPKLIEEFVDELGGIDCLFLTAGVGWMNPTLGLDVELKTEEVNVLGFTRVVDTAFKYFSNKQGGERHIAVISSIAGTKALSPAPAYSATKRFQNTYLSALAGMSHAKGLDISITDIRPGFVRTALLGSNSFPMMMNVESVAKKVVRAIEKKKRIVIVDWRYQLLVYAWRCLPLHLWERINLFRKK